jgi:hypothetical protein
MTPYIRNRSCQCTRCRAHGLMGAAVLITLGVLFLLDSYGVIGFHETFPILFLVIGGVLLISRTGSTDGHVQPGWIAGSVAPPVQQGPAITTPPPPSQQWASGADNPPSSSDQNDSQVKP